MSNTMHATPMHAVNGWGVGHRQPTLPPPPNFVDINFVNNLAAQVTNNTEQVKLLSDKLAGADTRVASLEDIIEGMQVDRKRKNCKLSGLEESRGESRADLCNKTLELIRSFYWDWELKEEDIEKIYRVGRRGQHPRPVILGFLRQEDAERMVKDRDGRGGMSRYGVRVGPDLTIRQRDEMNKLWEGGQRGVLKGGKVVPVSHEDRRGRKDWARDHDRDRDRGSGRRFPSETRAQHSTHSAHHGPNHRRGRQLVEIPEASRDHNRNRNRGEQLAPGRGEGSPGQEYYDREFPGIPCSPIRERVGGGGLGAHVPSTRGGIAEVGAGVGRNGGGGVEGPWRRKPPAGLWLDHRDRR